MTAPIGILGGTFDPIHYGHLRLAQELGEQLQLTEVRVIPGGMPPHRSTPAVAAEHRAQMVRLATSSNPLFVFDDRELKRAGPSYTVDTLAELRAQSGPRRPLALLMGADAFLRLTAWRRWRELFDLAHLVVAHRPGFKVDGWIDDMAPALAHEYAARRVDQALALHLTPAGAVFVTPITALDISATAIRQALRAGRTPRYLLPDAVLDYIRTNHLYL